MRFWTILFGAAAGAGAAFVVWKIASKKLDQEFGTAGARLLTSGTAQLHTAIDEAVAQTVVPKVQQAVQEKLDSVGITRTTGTQISRVLQIAQSMRLI